MNCGMSWAVNNHTWYLDINWLKHSIKIECNSLNLRGAEIVIFWDNQVNTIAADALATCVARSSAAMILIMQDKQVLVIHEERFQLPVPS